MGRDKFSALMKANNLLVRKTRRAHITTNSRHRFFKSPNRIKGITPTASEQIFVSDITYIAIEKEHAYLALVTDLYSKRIMGYQIQTHMRASLVKDALKMALKNCQYNTLNIIHHSDRGVQYCAPEFTQYAENKGLLLSTTQQYDPYENAVAERVNGILKYEFGLRKTLPNLVTARKLVAQAIQTYNTRRKHLSLEMQTPDEAHRKQQHQYKKYSQNM